MTKLEKTVRNTIRKFNMINHGDTVVLGVSGGADSVAMLHILSGLSSEYELKLVCVHLNHGIRGDEAIRDQEYVRKLCEKLNVDFVCEYRDIPAISKNTGQSEELVGRNERYALFRKTASDYGSAKIAVAHNMNDCSETVIMKLARGSSLNGLKGIPAVNGDIIRPLIECERSDIEAYLTEYGIEYMTDSTNCDTKYTRNLVRNRIIPLMKEINPSFVRTVYTNCGNIASDDDFIRQCADAETDKCVKFSDGISRIDMEYLKKLHIALQRRIILNAVQLVKGNNLDIEHKHIEILMSNLTTGKRYNLGAGLSAYVEYNYLCIAKEYTLCEDYEYNIECGKTYDIGNKRIIFDFCDNNDMSDKSCMYINADGFDIKNALLRNRRDGDRFSPSGMKGSKKLKSYFIDNKVTQAERNLTPLLCVNGEIAAVIGMRVSDKYTVDKNTKRILKIYINGGNYEQ